ncbi:uncharacterized protein LOC131211018 [Anopheles bellator]|uniref:uncharacterized protein LOC131211018 n=1 Tax=Anopheles bellator TaxID=139047 RepID=UPI002647021F|nr:uncharacterized protein LOC131211018 [Anopheles bellator]
MAYCVAYIFALLGGCLASERLYEVELNNLEVTPSEIEDFVDYGTLRLVRKARNTFAVSGTLSILQNIGDEAYIFYVIYKLGAFDGQRRKYLDGNGRVCKLISGDEYIYPQMLNYSNLPSKDTCPFPKGNYTVNDFVVDERKLPAIIPPGEWLIVVKLMRDGKLGAGYRINFTTK